MANKWLMRKDLFGALDGTTCTEEPRPAFFSEMARLHKAGDPIVNQRFVGCVDCVKPGAILFQKTGANISKHKDGADCELWVYASRPSRYK